MIIGVYLFRSANGAEQARSFESAFDVRLGGKGHVVIVRI
jgi:hypothetical protein